MAPLAKTDVLSLDDGGLATRSEENRRDWLALLEDRYDRRATIVTSQLPGEHWHEALGDPPLPTPSSLVWGTTPIRGT
jgi:DNA replication protein DnaC